MAALALTFFAWIVGSGRLALYASFLASGGGAGAGGLIPGTSGIPSSSVSGTGGGYSPNGAGSTIGASGPDASGDPAGAAPINSSTLAGNSGTMDFLLRTFPGLFR